MMPYTQNDEALVGTMTHVPTVTIRQELINEEENFRLLDFSGIRRQRWRFGLFLATGFSWIFALGQPEANESQERKRRKSW
jgi:hypothetical protein